MFKLLFIDDMDLDMAIANDFYKEIGNVEKAQTFSKMIGVEVERAKKIFLDLFLYSHGIAVLTATGKMSLDHDEDSRLEQKHGTVEFLTTMRYIQRYLSSGNRVLEIGAATGRYAHTLARQGYAVDAIELIEHNIEVFQRNTLPDENISIIQGNALDLSAFPDNQYDITLLLGPLYHLYTKEDKQQAIREAIRVTRPRGIIFAAYVISDGCLLDKGFHRNNINVADYIKNGLLDAETFAAKSEPKDLFELVRKEDIDDLMSIFPTTRLHYIAADGLSLFMREVIDAMENEAFWLYLKYHFAVCEREDLLGVTSHAVDIFKKES